MPLRWMLWNITPINLVGAMDPKKLAHWIFLEEVLFLWSVMTEQVRKRLYASSRAHPATAVVKYSFLSCKYHTRFWTSLTANDCMANGNEMAVRKKTSQKKNDHQNKAGENVQHLARFLTGKIFWYQVKLGARFGVSSEIECGKSYLF